MIPIENFGSWAAVPGAFGAGCVAAWGFAMKAFLPQRLKALEDRVAILTKEIEKLQDKADKYDALNEKLAQGRLAELDQ